MNDKLAFIFDLDGTIVDTNKLHWDTWLGAFSESGFEVDPEQVKMAIGKGGDNLIKDLIGDIDKDTEKKLSDLKSELYIEKLEKEHITVALNLSQLINKLHHFGFVTALATSGSRKDIKMLDKADKTISSNIEEFFDVIVTFDEVDSSKPDPDLLHLTLEKIGTTADRCVMVGDTTYDVEAAAKAGVRSIGLMSGYHSFEMLQNSGAKFVFKNIDDLFIHLEDVVNNLFPQK